MSQRCLPLHRYHRLRAGADSLQHSRARPLHQLATHDWQHGGRRTLRGVRACRRAHGHRVTNSRALGHHETSRFRQAPPSQVVRGPRESASCSRRIERTTPIHEVVNRGCIQAPQYVLEDHARSGLWPTAQPGAQLAVRLVLLGLQTIRYQSRHCFMVTWAAQQRAWGHRRSLASLRQLSQQGRPFLCRAR